MIEDVKPGFRTTEFWIAVLGVMGGIAVILATLYALVFYDVPGLVAYTLPVMGGAIIVGSLLIYTRSRVLVKKAATTQLPPNQRTI